MSAEGINSKDRQEVYDDITHILPLNATTINVALIPCVHALKYKAAFRKTGTVMGRTCGTYGGEERCIQGFSGET
jgi:hypothetical protein